MPLMHQLVVRRSGWAVGRWWLAAGTLTTLLTVTRLNPPLISTIIAAIVGFAVARRTPVPYGFLVSIPLYLILESRYEVITGFLSLTVFAWAVWQTLEWYATTITLTTEHVTVQHGIVNTKTVQIPRRRLIQAERERTIFGKLLGYAHVTFETAAQVEFVDRIRFVAPSFYDLITEPDYLQAALAKEAT